jgi:hypothetical protein
MSAIECKRSFVIIGTSGSPDYLKDTTGDRRFWPVTVPPPDLATLRVDRDKLWAEAAEFWADGVEFVPVEVPVCDGLHDEGAPVQYLCSRCFPDLRGDLSESQDDEYDDARRDDAEEME